VIKKG